MTPSRAEGFTRRPQRRQLRGPGLALLAGQVPAWALGQEYDLVEQATFTDPEDQSAWMYHRWLLSRSLALHAAARGAASEAEARKVPLLLLPWGCWTLQPVRELCGGACPVFPD